MLTDNAHPVTNHSTKCWKLNGSYLAPFHGLAEKTVQALKHVTTIDGIPVFTSVDLPRGIIELIDNGERVAVIQGLGQ